MNFALAGNIISYGKKDIKTENREFDLTRNSKIPPVLSGRILHSLGPTETFKLCQEKMISCPEGGLIYKFIKSSMFLGNVNPTLKFDHILKCNPIIKSETNPIGFKTQTECVKTILELREWAGLEELKLTDDQKTELFTEFKSEEALKCRWSRELAVIDDDNEWQMKLNECIETIKLELSTLGLGSFKEITFNYEPRHDRTTNIWDDIFDENGNYQNLKKWLDHGSPRDWDITNE